MMTQRLKELRKALGLTQQQVADELHLSRGTIGGYEQGHRIPPSDVLVILARLYRTTTDYLLGAADDPGRPPALDPFSREILEQYQSSDTVQQSYIYRQNMYLQEMFRYGGQKGLSLREPPASPGPSP